MAYSVLSPVSAAVFGKLNVAALLALAPGGVVDDVPQNPTFPFVLYEVSEREVGGFGLGALPEVTLRVRAYSQYAGMKDAQTIIAKVIELLRFQSLTIMGYDQCGQVFWDDTVTLPNEELNGVKVHEVVANFRIYAEEQ